MKAPSVTLAADVTGMIAATENDDPSFVDLAQRLLGMAVTNDPPAEVFAVRIDQWFDAKWLHFSGKILGALGVWKSPKTVPLFHPHRVIAETHFEWVPASERFESAPAQPLHIWQPSERNLLRSIAKVSSSAVFIWFSSSTIRLDRGSVMIYRIDGSEVLSWYAAFHRKQIWRLDRCRGISPEEIQHCLRFDEV